jgi:hypothetical protein
MAVFEVGEFTVYPFVTGHAGHWHAHYSVTTPDGRGGTHSFGNKDVPGWFATDDEAMEAARAAGRAAAEQLDAQGGIEPYRDDD